MIWLNILLSVNIIVLSAVFAGVAAILTGIRAHRKKLTDQFVPNVYVTGEEVQRMGIAWRETVKQKANQLQPSTFPQCCECQQYFAHAPYAFDPGEQPIVWCSKKCLAKTYSTLKM